MRSIRLGLIGDNIAASKAPLLHRLAGNLCGIDVSYELLSPAQIGLDFEALLARCARDYHGINITLPYKEAVVPHTRFEDADAAAIGACNTVVFGRTPAAGFNTDYSGFIAAYEGAFGKESPGLVALVGAGGVGKAVAFALVQLGARALRLFDRDAGKADATARSLAARYPLLSVSVAPSPEVAADRADGLVNCTPCGMVGYGGSAYPTAALAGARWAFDAVYTPAETDFIAAARARGLSVLSGYELFLHQGIDAFRIFTGHRVDATALRSALAQAGAGSAAS